VFKVLKKAYNGEKNNTMGSKNIDRVKKPETAVNTLASIKRK